MKVFFGSSPRIKEKYSDLVLKIYRLLEEYGHRHTSDWLKNLNPADFFKLGAEELDEYHRKTRQAIKEADLCVFEASMPSLSVGYLVNHAIEKGKTVVVLSQNVKSLALFRSIKSASLISAVYDSSNVEEKLKACLKEAAEKSDVRFNFFITPGLLSYLDWVAAKKRIPRSVFLRNLIEREIKKDKEYKTA